MCRRCGRSHALSVFVRPQLSSLVCVFNPLFHAHNRLCEPGLAPVLPVLGVPDCGRVTSKRPSLSPLHPPPPLVPVSVSITNCALSSVGFPPIPCSRCSGLHHSFFCPRRTCDLEGLNPKRSCPFASRRVLIFLHILQLCLCPFQPRFIDAVNMDRRVALEREKKKEADRIKSRKTGERFREAGGWVLGVEGRWVVSPTHFTLPCPCCSRPPTPCSRCGMCMPTGCPAALTTTRQCRPSSWPRRFQP